MCAYLGPNDIYTLPKKIELFLETYPACAEIAQLEDGHLPIHVICNGPSRDVCLVPFLEANPFSVLTPTPLGETPLELACNSPGSSRKPNGNTGLLQAKQDEVVRLLRDTIRSAGEEAGLPDLVASTICSFALPQIHVPTEDEMTW